MHNKINLFMLIMYVYSIKKLFTFFKTYIFKYSYFYNTYTFAPTYYMCHAYIEYFNNNSKKFYEITS